MFCALCEHKLFYFYVAEALVTGILTDKYKWIIVNHMYLIIFCKDPCNNLVTTQSEDNPKLFQSYCGITHAVQMC